MIYLQFAVGSIAGRYLVADLFLPAFFKSDCITIYDFIARILASGVRLMVAATSVAKLSLAKLPNFKLGLRTIYDLSWSSDVLAL